MLRSVTLGSTRQGEMGMVSPLFSGNAQFLHSRLDSGSELGQRFRSMHARPKYPCRPRSREGTGLLEFNWKLRALDSRQRSFDLCNLRVFDLANKLERNVQ